MLENLLVKLLMGESGWRVRIFTGSVSPAPKNLPLMTRRTGLWGGSLCHKWLCLVMGQRWRRDSTTCINTVNLWGMRWTCSHFYHLIRILWKQQLCFFIFVCISWFMYMDIHICIHIPHSRTPHRHIHTVNIIPPPSPVLN